MTRTERKARTAKAIADAAERLYRDKGYNATTTREIAAAAGYSTGALFACYPDGLRELWTVVTGEPVPGEAAWTGECAA